MGIWAARATISRPLLDLAAAARAMSTGDLGVKLTSKGTDEVKELAASFDRMRASMVALGTKGDDDDDDLSIRRAAAQQVRRGPHPLRVPDLRIAMMVRHQPCTELPRAARALGQTRN